MDFELTPEQNMLKKSFQEFLAKECPFDVVREIRKSDMGYSPKIWKKMADLGWLGLVFEEKYGGSEGAFLDLFVLFEELGKAQLPSPLFASPVMAGFLISEAGSDAQKEAYLPRLIDGKKIFTVALPDETPVPAGRKTVISTGRNPDGDYILNGEALLVPHADVADMILFCAEDQNRSPILCLADSKSSGLRVSALRTITEERKFVVACANVRVSGKNVIAEADNAKAALERMKTKAMVLKCGEMIGGFKQVLDMTVNYASQRKQFGVPIGKFQAIQHFCAEMAIDLQGAQLIAYQAASAISSGASGEVEAAMAKAWCSDTYVNATRISQQIHGGIGFTDEFAVGLYFKHAKESELMFGHSKIKRQHIANAIGL
jgi:alkylation response protein AidB-like acyl-CoA dehydrogenase